MTLQITEATPSKDTISVQYSSSAPIEYLNIWLRDNCHCSECHDGATHQRLVDTFKIPTNIKALSTKITDTGLSIEWNDGHSSFYDTNWLVNHTKEFTKSEAVKVSTFPERGLWDKDNLPYASYNDIIKKNPNELYTNIWKYGFSFIKDVPVTPEDTENMLKAIGYIRHTHYGGFWDFTSDLSMKDTAYSDIEIPSHTDGTYWEHTPYLQLFHLLFHDGEGGLTTLVDAFKCAKDFQKEYPEQYLYLSNLRVECHSLGDVYLTQAKPIFIHDQHTKELVQISWNNSDRSTNFKLSNDELKKFYEGIRIWNEIIHREENVLDHKLQPGTALIFDNWRVLHSRIGKFTGKRRMCGAYFDREDFMSTLTLTQHSKANKDELELFQSV